MRRKNLLASAAIGLLSLAMFSLETSLQAQSFYGGISGTVTDSTGAVVAGATVTVINLGTNETQKALSGAAGEYRFVNLLPANYKLDVEAKSFKRFEIQPVVVQVDGTVRVDAQMQLGATTETVTVTTEAPLLQTESGTVGTEVESAVVTAMPLNGRNAMNLIGLTPGIVPTSGATGAAGFNSGNRTSFANWGGYQIGGAFTNENALYIDGATDNLLQASLTALIPSQDAVQEFKVESSVPSAEYGRFGGGVIEMTTKSGANAFHGTVYEYIRNTILNAGNFVTKNQDQPTSAFHQNQYGAAIGGPIKRDRAFFFFSWENFSLHEAQPGVTNVPGDGKNGTTNMRGGVFADTIGGKARTIADPVYTNSKGTKGCNIMHNTAAGTFNIPASCFDATALVMMGYYPGTNSTANASSNYVGTSVIGNGATQYNARIDYNVSNKQLVFGRYTQWPMSDTGQNEFHNYGGFPTGYAGPTNEAHSIVVGDTYTISPTTIADGRISYTRFYSTNNAPSAGYPNLAQFGPAYAALSSVITYKTLPTPIFSGSDSIFSLTPMSNIEYDWYNNYAINGSLTKIVGTHSFKFGGEGVLREHTGTGHFHAPGYSTFSNTTTGDEVASFLLGEFTTDLAQTQLPVTTFNYSWGFYGTDAWKVNRNLTLNLGLRWELPGGSEEKKDRATVLLPNTADPTTGNTGAIVLVNSSMYPSRSMEPFHYDLFSPRVSFAENLSSSFVVRGGYAIAFLPPDIPVAEEAYASPVNAAITTQTNPTVPTYYLANPFPGGIQQPTGRGNRSFTSGYKGQSETVVVPTSNYPYIGQWNLSVGKQWKGDWSTEIDYAGTKGTHLPENVAYSIDQPTTAQAATLQTMENNLIAGGTSATTAASTTVAAGKAIEPYPYYQNLLDGARYTGSSTYNALYLVAQKRFRSGGLINANYTWAKMITDTDVPNANATNGVGGTGYPQDYTNQRSDRSLAAFNVPNRLVVSYVLNLPFGNGQRLASGIGGVTDRLVSGWTVNGITTVQSGFPLVMSYNGNSLSKNLNSGTIRPNYVAGCNKMAGVPKSTYQRFLTNNWFNAACFTYPGDFSFGNEPRVDPSLKGEGLTNFDFSLLKATTIKESVNLQFRAEAFNLFNHPYFPAPGTIMAGTSYNSVNLSNAYINPRLIQLSLRLNF